MPDAQKFIDAVRLGPSDVERFLAFRARGLDGDPDAFRITAEDDAALAIDSWRARLEQDYVVAIVAEDGEWLGIGGLTQFEGEKLRHKGLIWGMYVAPAARGSGAADRIVAALVDHGSRTLRQLLLTVMADNARARALYERHGFETYAIEPQSVLRNGIYEDEALMWRHL